MFLCLANLIKSVFLVSLFDCCYREDIHRSNLYSFSHFDIMGFLVLGCFKVFSLSSIPLKVSADSWFLVGLAHRWHIIAWELGLVISVFSQASTPCVCHVNSMPEAPFSSSSLIFFCVHARYDARESPSQFCTRISLHSARTYELSGVQICV